MRPTRDEELVQIVDAALADAARRAHQDDGTSWLTCRPGCTPCCHGVFRISALDAVRLHEALGDLDTIDKASADAIRERAARLVEELRPLFPGFAATGLLHPEEHGGWDEFADLPAADAPCPVLDPLTGRCELYAARPLTCRIFGPPVRSEGGLGLCELCYVGAPEAALLAGEMHLTHHALEEALDRELPPVETIIAWALVTKPQCG